MTPIDAAFSVLKALPEHQMFSSAYPRENLAEKTYDHTADGGIDVGERQTGEGTIHPAIYGMMERQAASRRELPNLNLDVWQPNRHIGRGYPASIEREGVLEGHPERNAPTLPYGSVDDPTDQWEAYHNPDNKRMTSAPQTSAYQKDHPTDEEVRNFGRDYPQWRQDLLSDTELGRRAAVTKMNGNEQTAMMHDLPSYMEEALNQKRKTRGEARKKKDKASKLRQHIDDHHEDADVMNYYKDNHPDWFNSFRNGGGE
jgi:hypothetical protein